MPPRQLLDCSVRCEESLVQSLQSNESLIKRLAGLEGIKFLSSAEKTGKSIVHVDKGFELFVAAEGLIDIEKEKVRLSTEIQRIEKILKGIIIKLNNADFVAKAPREVIESSETQKENLTFQLAALRSNLNGLT